MIAAKLLFGGLALGAACSAQTLKVYSEFQRVDPHGNVVPMDRGVSPREILSPAVARNAWASFHVVVSAAPRVPFALHIGQNPENAVRAELFLEMYNARGDARVPEQLTPVALPYEGTMPVGHTHQSFWLDLWVAREAPVDRIKVEPQLNVDNDWIVYPMEVRVTSPVTPAVAAIPMPAVSFSEPADSFACLAWVGADASSTAVARPAPLTISARIFRNARQDRALARSFPRARALAERCAAKDRRAPEWYLRVRDSMLRERQ